MSTEMPVPPRAKSKEPAASVNGEVAVEVAPAPRTDDAALAERAAAFVDEVRARYPRFEASIASATSRGRRVT